MKSPLRIVAFVAVLAGLTFSTGTIHGAVQAPPEPEQMNEIRRAAAIAVYEDLVKNSSPVNLGDSEEQLLQRLGKPEGIMSFGNKKRLDYGRGYAIIAGGKIVKIDGIAPERLSSPDNEAYESYQKALGKVHYMDQWMTPDESQAAYMKALESRERELERISHGKAQTIKRKERIAREQGGLTEIRQNGAQISQQDLVVPGKFTVVDFFADWCGPCKAIDPYLKKLAEDPRVAVRKVDIVNWKSPVAKQWKLRSIPNMRLYGPDGRLIGQPTSDFNQIIAWINQSLQGLRG
jgi:thiol-disulfide isomerase/thioredoxin